MTPTLETTVGAIATEHPLATRVFARHGIDFCCGGGAPLSQACARRGLDASAVLHELEEELRGAPEERRWDQAPLEDLIEHLLERYHASLKEELPRLEAMARKVHQVHGSKAPEQLAGVLQAAVALREELLDHMAKEELVLFPLIQQGRGRMAGPPVGVMRQEHDSCAALLQRLRRLTGDYTVPAAACTTWRALWHGLAALEEDLHQHMHLENNVLFPRALA